MEEQPVHGSTERTTASTHCFQSTVPGRTARAPAYATPYSSPRRSAGTGRQHIRCYGKTNRRSRSRRKRTPDRTCPLTEGRREQFTFSGRSVSKRNNRGGMLPFKRNFSRKPTRFEKP